MKYIVIAFAVVFVASTAVLIAMMSSRSASPPEGAGAGSALVPDEMVEGMFVPPFELVDQTGATIDGSVFEGRVTIASFFFTNCPFICPDLLNRQALLYEDLAGEGVAFLSVSVDPTNDTVEKIAQKANGLGAEHPQWRFATGEGEMTGPDATSWKMLSEGMEFALEFEPETLIDMPEGDPMANIIHPGHYALIGPTGEVLGMYRSSEAEERERLRARALAAARELRGEG